MLDGDDGHTVVKDFWKIVEYYHATSFSGVPTFYTNLLRVPVDADIRSLKTAICGAAPMPGEVYKAFERHTGVSILEGDGLTEATCAISTNPRYGERRVGSIGLRYPYQAMKAALLDQHSSYVRDCQPNETGTLVVKGPNVFAGYVQEEQNVGLWVADGWLNTGDLGRQDEDGYFWLSGRAKGIVNLKFFLDELSPRSRFFRGFLMIHREKDPKNAPSSPLPRENKPSIALS